MIVTNSRVACISIAQDSNKAVKPSVRYESAKLLNL